LNHCLRLSNFPMSWKETKFILLSKPGEEPRFPKVYVLFASCPQQASSMIRFFQKYSKGMKTEVCLMQASLVSVPNTVRHFNVWGLQTRLPYISTTRLRLRYFLDIENAFDTTWHLELLHTLPKLNFSISLIKLISSFLSQRKFRVSVEAVMSAPRDI
jgi:hypothetical protein